ncbi:MAG: (2Fe-2S)-binding protein [Proteobacteria bacterium]|nr:(2Fe-2S)-binding protein [Pseudomonadota bacterium]
MAPVSHFERLPCVGGEVVTITIDGEAHEVDSRWTVAAALIAHGHTRCRCTPEGQSRGPFCMSGVCFECRVDIDGTPNRQACMTPVAAGMRVVLRQDLRALA